MDPKSLLAHVPTDLYVGGEWQPAAERLDVLNPATEEVLCQVADGGPEDAKRAADAASEAFRTWRKTSAYERAKLLRLWFEAVREHREELAILITLENGKPLGEARGEVDYAASFIEWFSEEAKRVYGRTVPAGPTDKRILVLKQPVGVVAAVTPWNFPAAMITRKVAPALAAGCTVVLKPAAQTPLTSLRLLQLWEEVGGPPGTFNHVTTLKAREVADVWLDDPRVRKFTFTGSTAVGQELMAKAAKNMVRLSLELGGQAPFVVFDDADLDVVMQGLAVSKFRNAGQSCIASNRILVDRRIADEVADRAKALVSGLKVGSGLEEGVSIGPMIDGNGRDKVLSHIEDAKGKGAVLVAGGQEREGRGYFVDPTVLTGVTEEMRVMQEETFGPVVAIAPFEREEEAVRLANASPFGLAAYFFTSDASRAWRVAEDLEYGIIGLNDGLPSTAQAPFGGVKLSGMGREGGQEGIEAFLEHKYVSWGNIRG